tara:strand:+ start:78 stop:272 length:195 start_codon:yes stop_codon:yes gene_type:complete
MKYDFKVMDGVGNKRIRFEERNGVARFFISQQWDEEDPNSFNVVMVSKEDIQAMMDFANSKEVA